MRIFAISDLHLDYEQNQKWLQGLSASDFKNDILILAGDISDDLVLLELCFGELTRRFKSVLFVPGNHDLWVLRDKKFNNSFDKFHHICGLAKDYNIALEAVHYDSLTIVPLLSWYDYSFGAPCEQIKQVWMDFKACDWGRNIDAGEITRFFLERNDCALINQKATIITFSHFLPRIDVMPDFIPSHLRYLYPVLGSSLIDAQVRQLGSNIHVYGHSHLNRNIIIDGIRYINNAFGYPGEANIAAKHLKCIFETNF
jgi:predicted phosphodiesterase